MDLKMEDLIKKVLELMDTYSVKLNEKNEIFKASTFKLNNQSCGKYYDLGISILLKEELLNEKDIDLFDITLKYQDNEILKIYIYEISICTSDGVVYLEFSDLIIQKKDFIRFIKLFLDEAIRLYEENVVLYLKKP